MTKRWPDYWDLCLQCRYAGLDNVADFIHETMDQVQQMHAALSNISQAQYNADSKDIANAALEKSAKMVKWMHPVTTSPLTGLASLGSGTSSVSSLTKQSTSDKGKREG